MTPEEKAIKDLQQLYRNIGLKFEDVSIDLRESLIEVWVRGYKARTSEIIKCN